MEKNSVSMQNPVVFFMAVFNITGRFKKFELQLGFEGIKAGASEFYTIISLANKEFFDPPTKFFHPLGRELQWILYRFSAIFDPFVEFCNHKAGVHSKHWVVS